MKKVLLTFDKRYTKDILRAFGKSVSGDGIIFDEKTKQNVLSPSGEEVRENEFGGIRKGSLVFMKSDILSMIDYVERSL